MNNEARPSDNGSKDIRIPISGLVDRAIVALVGAILGFGGSTAYQSLDPRARADSFTASDHAKWVHAEHEPLEGKVLWIERQMTECEEYRKKDSERVQEIKDAIRGLDWRIKSLEKQ